MNGNAKVSTLRFHLRDGVTEEMVRELSALKNEPDWMLDLRLDALQVFQDIPMPMYLSERKTDLRRFKLDPFHAYADAPEDVDPSSLPSSIQDVINGEGAAGLVVQQDSTARQYHLPDELREQGVIFTDMDSAVHEYPELVQEYFARDGIAEDKFVSLNLALWSGGAFLYVPSNAAIQQPFYAYHQLDTENLGLFEHSLVIIDRAAQATFFHEVESGDDTAPGLRDGMLEVYQLDGSVLNLVTVQNLNQSVTDFSTSTLVVGRDAQLTSTQGVVGGKLSRSSIETVLADRGANLEDYCFFVGNNKQHLDLAFFTRHESPETFCEMIARGALNNKARSVYHGLIRIEKGAQKSNGGLTENTLLLSRGARSDATPSLEILADDVKAGHGASVGQVEEEQIFYLMSRGLSRSEARNMIVNGFFAPLLARVPQESARSRLQELIGAKVAQ